MTIFAPDAIIVLSHGMESNCKLNNESIQRATAAAEKFITLKPKALITCGWRYRTECDVSLAGAYSCFIQENFQIDAKYILKEESPKDTVGEAFFTKINIVKPKEWQRLLIITSDYHVPRTAKIFKFIYGNEFQIEVFGTAVEGSPENIEKEKNAIEKFKETFAGILAGDDINIEKAIRQKHALYSGDLYPKK